MGKSERGTDGLERIRERIYYYPGCKHSRASAPGKLTFQQLGDIGAEIDCVLIVRATSNRTEQTPKAAAANGVDHRETSLASLRRSIKRSIGFDRYQLNCVAIKHLRTEHAFSIIILPQAVNPFTVFDRRMFFLAWALRLC